MPGVPRPMARLGELRSSVTNKVKHAIHSGPFSPSKRTAAAEPPKDRNDPHGRDMHAGPTILTADKIGEVLKSNKELNALLDGIERERIKVHFTNYIAHAHLYIFMIGIQAGV
mmetsp:Transcript_5369/g.13995  ORF Transcript_5369/g.13995 Transcript_5369/m.13995 type:complete len:113 (+) Transcript_5369:423-761(+)